MAQGRIDLPTAQRLAKELLEKNLADIVGPKTAKTALSMRSRTDIPQERLVAFRPPSTPDFDPKELLGYIKQLDPTTCTVKDFFESILCMECHFPVSTLERIDKLERADRMWQLMALAPMSGDPASLNIHDVSDYVLFLHELGKLSTGENPASPTVIANGVKALQKIARSANQRSADYREALDAVPSADWEKKHFVTRACAIIWAVQGSHQDAIPPYISANLKERILSQNDETKMSEILQEVAALAAQNEPMQGADYQREHKKDALSYVSPYESAVAAVCTALVKELSPIAEALGGKPARRREGR